MDDLKVLILFALIAIFSFIAGKSSYSNMLSACAHEHNVYKCELVAVPKGGKL